MSGPSRSEDAAQPMFAVCRVDDIPNQRARGFVLLRRGEDGGERPWPILVLRWGRHILGYENACPHQQSRLDWERDDFLDGSGTRFACGKHGALFDFGTGTCVEGPCAGERLTSVELAIDDGDICVVGVELAEDQSGAAGEDRADPGEPG